ncbi:hypothetical protein BRD18_08435 [Halobacteriales archaeon SW_7_71_33]|nr:MAG: hypothetical protein BRD18_08435 [Halobacteriales archaeon SW_7_71_33]
MNLKSVIAIVALVGVGAAIMTGGWIVQQEEQQRIENAVEHEGTVRNTGVERMERTERRDPDNDGQYESRERVVEFVPTVRYTYTYEGTEHESDSIYPVSRPEFDSRAEAENFTARFPEGERVTVYVNEADPSESFLVEKKSGTPLLVAAAVFGGLFWLLAAAVGYRSTRE